LVAVVALLAGASAGWKKAPPMPLARSEVAATAYRGGVAVIGGFLPGCTPTKAVELYQPARRRWRRLPDLPAALHHASAAASGPRLYVVGGYARGPNIFPRSAYVYDGRRWRRLTAMPEARAAAAAAIAGGRLYVVGGVTPKGLAEEMLVLDLATGKWSAAPGPGPREHLSAAAAGGKVYALGGRLGGPDANVATFEGYSAETGAWAQLASVPEPRGGSGLAASSGLLVSAGGEETERTLRSVYAYDIAAAAWRRLPDLPTARHGLALVAIQGRVYAIGGSPIPDCGYSGLNEVLDIRS
jgi:serine/threonine-protein kinase PknK